MFVINIPYLDLNKIYDSGLAFMWRKINTDDYIVIHKDKAIRVKQLKDTIMLECTENDFFDIWYNYFDCGTDYETIHHNIKNIPNFKLKSEIAKGVRLIKPSLLESIIYAVLDTTPDKARYYIQNIAISYSKKQLKSIRNMGKVEYYEFPTKQQILDQKKLLNIGVKTDVLIHFLENVNISYL